MGTAYVPRYYAKCDVSQLRRKVSQDIENDRHEHGHGIYTGHWGSMTDTSIHFGDDAFTSHDDAENWLHDNLQKQGPFIAVKVIQRSSFDQSGDKKLQALSTKLYTINNAIAAMDDAILARVKTAKSDYRCCTSCRSRISIKHLCTSFCPVCRRERFIYTNTDTKKLQRLTQNANKIEQDKRSRQDQIAARQRAYVNSRAGSHWAWLVGAYCPE